jgi:hypothetical protein
MNPQLMARGRLLEPDTLVIAVRAEVRLEHYRGKGLSERPQRLHGRRAGATRCREIVGGVV